MTTAELAKDFTALLKRNADEEAASKYNSDNIASYEAGSTDISTNFDTGVWLMSAMLSTETNTFASGK